MPKIYFPKRNLDQLHRMREIWLDSKYPPSDIAFRIRAVELARIESKIYHAEQQEDRDHGIPASDGTRQFEVVFV